MVGLDLDRDDFLDHKCTDDLSDQCGTQHVAANLVGEQHHHVFVIQFEHDQEQDRRQCQQNCTAHTAFARQRLDLSEDHESFTNQMSDLVEDLG